MSNKFIFRFVVTMEKNKSLRNLNTFGIDVTAKYFVSISSVEELKELSNTHTFNEENLLILGGGSNILLTKDFHGIVLKNNICLLYTSPSPRDNGRSRMPSSA